mgnify:CR=1 FL=1
MARKKTVSEPVEKEENLPVVIDFEDDADSGLEAADSDSFAIPLLKVLQKVSPQCDKDDGAYIKGAVPGDFYNSVTNELYPGDKGVIVIPCNFKHTCIEWVPRDSGGGFVAEHNPTSPDIAARTRLPNKATERLPNGNDIEDTRSHYCLLIKNDGSFESVLLPLTSTQIPVSKKWVTRIKSIRKPKSTGGVYNPASFSHMYRLTTITKSNDKGSWKLIEIDMVGPVTEPLIYGEAKALYNAVQAGAVQAQHDAPQTEKSVEEGTEY